MPSFVHCDQILDVQMQGLGDARQDGSGSNASATLHARQSALRNARALGEHSLCQAALAAPEGERRRGLGKGQGLCRRQALFLAMRQGREGLDMCRRVGSIAQGLEFIERQEDQLFPARRHDDLMSHSAFPYS